ncbi:chloride channel 3/4/5 [Entomortierella parvispora]|uniref:Chloride channel protein n=1 Tax=Entomortierella parvispora TaxID=205924 RepID=A0A9P3LV48_9FUNG|nr:chloride channel 3/4/5 [Entomortierella parvispora]
MDSSHDDHDLDGMIANSISRSNNSNNTRAGRLPSQLLEPHPANADLASPIYGFDDTTSVNSPLAHMALQPGMSPAIQRGTSLGLALGGSGFRRKALFGPEEADEEEEDLLEEEQGLDPKRVSGSGNGKSRKATRKGSRTLQNLTQSVDEEDDQAIDRIDGVDEEDEDDEEDADSETPLQPQEPIRGLESRHDFNFFKNRNQPESRTKPNSFLSRLGVAIPAAMGGSSGGSSGMIGSAGQGSGRTGSPRLGIGPFSSASRMRSQGRYPGKIFLPRTSSYGQPGSAGSGDGGTSAGGSDNIGSDFPSTGGSNPSPIYTGGPNPYHDDAVDWVVEGTGMRVAYDDFTTIDWIHDFAEERQRTRRLHRQPGVAGQIAVMYDWIQGWVVVLAVGIAAGIVAGGSDIASQWLGDIKEGYCDTAFYLNRNFCCWGLEDDACTDWVPWNSATFLVGYVFYIMFALTFATTAAYLVKTFAPYAEGSGIPEVKTILGGFVIRHYLGLETLVIKTVTLVLSTAAGLSLGKEGPLLHISCCIGNILPRIFPKFKRNEAKMREILSAAASAGISVAFGAPIGGVVFSLEEMSYYFSSDTMWHSFFCAMAAAVALKLMDPFRTEKLVVFQVSYDRDWHGFEMFFYMILGILGGLWGAFFIRMNLRLAAFRKTSWLRYFPIYEVFAVCLLTAVVGYLNIFTRVQAPELLANLFRACDSGATNYHGLCDEGGVTLRVFSLFSASAVKGLLTILTFGLAIPAGIFMPSMVIGALFGRALGMVVQAWQVAHPGFWIFASCLSDEPCVTPGSYAMVGAAAFMGGVTRMTVSLVIIMFELTGALTYVLPIMIVVMTSKWVGDAFGKEGIFDGIILLCGYPFLDDKEEYKLNTTASQVMTPVEDIVVVTATGNTLDSLDNLLHETAYKGYPVVNSLRDMMLVGYISRTELRYAIDEARKRNLPGNTPAGNVVPILENTPAFIEFRLWMDQTPITVSHRFPMDQVIVIFRKLGVRYVLCTQHGQLLGLITKKDVLRHLASIEHPGDQELAS